MPPPRPSSAPPSTPRCATWSAPTSSPRPSPATRRDAYAVALSGPPLGGLLFGLGRALPFLGNALSHLLSLVAVSLIRRPLQEVRREAPQPAAVSAIQGLRFLLGHPFLRALLVIAAPLNMAFTGMIFAMTLALLDAGVAPALVGLAGTVFALGGFLGALVAPALQRRLPLPLLMKLLCWTTAALMAVSTLLAGTVPAAIPLAAAVFLGPTANAALFAHQAAVTPDHLQGRVVSSACCSPRGPPPRSPPPSPVRSWPVSARHRPCWSSPSWWPSPGVPLCG